MTKLSVFLGVFFCFISVFAQGPLGYSAEHFFQAESAPRVGIEIEITHISGVAIVEILQDQVGGQWEYYDKPEIYVDKQTGKTEKYSVREIHLKNSKLGTVIIKPEENSLQNSNLAELTENTKIYEIVSEPIRFPQVLLLQNVLDDLKKAGAEGTLEGHAVAIQVSVEMGEGQRQKISARKIIAVLRNYLKPSHRNQIAGELSVPDFRQPYLGPFTPGMMNRLMDENYKPTNSEFYVDFMYRQALELLGYQKAWKAPEKEIRRLLKNYLSSNSFDRLLPVYKWNFVRTSAVLMYLFPNDWLSRYLVETTWFHDYPILEFREGNSDFDLLSKVKGYVGMIQYSLSTGDFELNPSTNELESASEQTPGLHLPLCFELF